jgi:hypothetical protein
VRREDDRGPPPGPLDGSKDGRFLRRIDEGGLARLRIMQKDTEIIAPAHELLDLDSHCVSPHDFALPLWKKR